MDQDSNSSDEERPEVLHPLPVVPLVPDYAGGEGEYTLVTLCKMPLMEAEMAAVKLQSEGIQVTLTDRMMASTDPWVITQVRVQVRETDLEEAKAILARPAVDDGEGEYADEEWRCPKCHRKDIELLKLPKAWRQVRNAWVMLLIVPVLLRFLRSAFPDPTLDAIAKSLGDWTGLYVIVLLVGGVWLLFFKRQKKCRNCGHQWTHANK